MRLRLKLSLLHEKEKMDRDDGEMKLKELREMK